VNDDVLNQENEAGRMGRNPDVERDDETTRKDDRSIFTPGDEDIEDGDKGDFGSEEAYR
jgi:hypothetical protein